MLGKPLFKFSLVVVVVATAACDDRRTIASLGPSCPGNPQVAPNTATIRVGESVDIAMTIDQGCSAPTALNETPSVINLATVSTSTVRVTGRAAGAGRVRFRSSADTLATLLVPITVTP